MTDTRFHQCRVCNHHFIYLVTFYDGMDRCCAIKEVRKMANSGEFIPPALVLALLAELDDTRKSFDEEMRYARGEARNMQEQLNDAREREP